MSKYPEIPSNKTKNVTQPDKSVISYKVRQYGMNGVVFEEELFPVPTQRIIRTMKEDGTEDVTKRKTEEIIKEAF